MNCWPLLLALLDELGFALGLPDALGIFSLLLLAAPAEPPL